MRFGVARLLFGGGGARCAAVPLHPDLLAVLVGPESKAPLLYFAGGEDGTSGAVLLCPTSRLRYRIDGDIPVLLIDEAERVSEAACAALVAKANQRA